MKFLGFKIIFKHYIPEHKIVSVLKEHCFYKNNRSVFYFFDIQNEKNGCVFYWGLIDYDKEFDFYIDIDECVNEAKHSILERFESDIISFSDGIMDAVTIVKCTDLNNED